MQIRRNPITGRGSEEVLEFRSSKRQKSPFWIPTPPTYCYTCRCKKLSKSLFKKSTPNDRLGSQVAFGPEEPGGGGAAHEPNCPLDPLVLRSYRKDL